MKLTLLRTVYCCMIVQDEMMEHIQRLAAYRVLCKAADLMQLDTSSESTLS